jgi:hypothetical protein
MTFTACGSSADSDTVTESTSAADSSETAETSSEENDSEDNESIIAKVTAVDGNIVTADIGDITSMSMNMGGGDAPDKPDGEAPDGENGGDAPEKPDGEAPNGENGGDVPDKPDGEDPDGENGGGDVPDKPDGGNGGGMGGGSVFEESGETVTFTLTDNTKVTLEYLQGSGEGTLDDIAVGTVIEFTLDDDGNALEVTVRNLNAGGGFGGSGEVTNGTSANTIDSDTSVDSENYSSSGDDENALRIDGVSCTLDNITVEKSGGNSSNTEDGDFYGQNAALLALNGAEVTITGANVTTDAVNGNGVFSYGEGTTVNIYDSVIRTSQNNSGGIQTTGGGTTNAYNLDIETSGNSAAAIRSDRGGGDVNVTGGTYVTNGTGSPAIYCTADISVSDADLTANRSEGVVVEGKNSVALTNCDLTSSMENTYNGDSDENIHAIMIYQSMSGDADVGKSYFTADGGSITSLAGDMFYITNTDCEISLKNVVFTLANDTFLRIEGNSSSRGWGTQGANGGDVVLSAEDQVISGNILVDSISSLAFTMSGSTSLDGAINPDGEGGTVDVVIEEGSTWNLTGDSYITSFDGDISQITSNGYHVYVNGEAIV